MGNRKWIISFVAVVELLGLPYAVLGAHDGSAPTAPRGVIGHGRSDSSIELMWWPSQDNAGISHYNVYRCPDSACAGGYVLAGIPSTNYFLDTGLIPATAYSYKVTAVDPEGNESPPAIQIPGYSTSVHTQPPGGTVTISMVESPTTVAPGWAFRVRWQPIMDPIGTFGHHDVHFTTSLDLFGCNDSPNCHLYDVTHSGNVYSVYAEAPAQTQDIFWLADPHAIGPNYNSTYHNYFPLTRVVVTNGNPLAMTTAVLPDAVSGIYYSQIITHNNSSEAAGPFSCGISQGRLPNKLILSSACVISGTPTETGSFVFTARVKASSENYAMQQLTLTVGVGVGTPDTLPPSTPTGLTATAVSPSQINLSWNVSTNDVGVAGYRVYRDGGLIATTTATSYSDEGRSPSTAYSYTVEAFDASGNVSGDAAPASDTTLALSPISIGINDVTVLEGNAGTVDAVFTVSLSAASGQVITVDYATADAMAAAADDYLARLGTLTFPAGTTTQTIAVPVMGDTAGEPDEIFFVYLSNASGAALADAQGVGVITNDDVEVSPFGLSGEYYSNANLTALSLTRTDARINFNWELGSPDSTMDPDTFSVRWTGSLQVDQAETYTFEAVADDGLRLWIDGRLIMDYWQTGGASTSGSMVLTAGFHDLKLEYFDSTGDAYVYLYGSSPSTAFAIVPSDHLFPPGSLGNAPVFSWTGEADYTSDGLNPHSGDAATAFVYRVKYTDADGDGPMAGFPRVHILKGGREVNGSPFAMSWVSGTFAAGAVYSYTTPLAAGTDYVYYFDAKDATGLQAVAAPTAPTPTVPFNAPDINAPVVVSGDLDGSGRIDGFDLGRLGLAFGSRPGDTRWDPDADLNQDGIVNAADATILMNNFGKTL